ncbi:SAM-dependent methyltransferase [Kineococcus terrestris]|uniref:SAM-dependent methyltransferase n=1 Tax=Kineococcus terrestris TaxID=2044856 RepID=UPI0034DB29CD
MAEQHGERELERFDADWLALREPVDHASRSERLEELLLRHLPAPGAPLRVVDLGAGAGSTLRHLAPRLAAAGHARQEWTLADHDEALLRRALAGPRPDGTTPDGQRVRVDAVAARLDLGDADALAAVLRPAGRPADVVVASALLDVLTPAAAAVLTGALGALDPRPPVLLALTVTGSARLDPPADGDDAVAAAFDADQRRHGLGPDATGHVAGLLAAGGWRVHREPSPWRLGPATRPLLEAWLDGWLAPARAGGAGPDGDRDWDDWRGSRLADPGLRARVGHEDLLALPARPPA